MTYDVYLHPKYLKKYQKLEDKDPQVHDFIKIGLNKLKRNPFDKEIELPPTFKKLGILDFLTYFN